MVNAIQDFQGKSSIQQEDFLQQTDSAILRI